MKYVSFSNGSAIAVTLPQAGGTGFASNFVFVSCDIGGGTATITPTTSTISYSNGSAYTSAAASLALTTGQCAWIYSDNTNYFAILHTGGSGGGSGVDPLDATTFSFDEEFIQVAGSLGWAQTTFQGSLSLSGADAVVPNLGIVNLATGATSGDGGEYYPTGGYNQLGNMGGNANWDTKIIFQISSTANIAFWVGVNKWGSSLANATTDGIWLKMDTAAGDTVFKAQTCKASTCTTSATTYTADTNFHKVRIRSTVAGTVCFTFDANAEDCSITTNAPTTAVEPGLMIVTRTTAGKTLTVDKFAFKWTGLSR